MATVKQIELKLKRINSKIDKLTKELGAAKKEKIKVSADLKKLKVKTGSKTPKAAGKKGKSTAAGNKKATAGKTAKKKAPAKKTVVNANSESLLS